MKNKLLFSSVIYFFLFIWWFFSSYFASYGITIFSMPLWFFLSCILFSILSLLLVCIFVIFLKND
ncbi:DUF997 domain-containing protein [Candidatus Borreliella tachyglossi]|uniref:DUF997 domain-containing protein n=1 Tax=Candidatus Borreliella tachyglossi TaxID=1964448 RepID=A0A2S1LXY3_9SPIR|nr:DUF997 family protein [Candidatus Borreliella tachyglossi]AWG43159.1 DUF997 domain-containing protein [Candidatus Borreliella tachyglossi]